MVGKCHFDLFGELSDALQRRDDLRAKKLTHSIIAQGCVTGCQGAIRDLRSKCQCQWWREGAKRPSAHYPHGVGGRNLDRFVSCRLTTELVSFCTS
jgi:hypothetical protein